MQRRPLTLENPSRTHKQAKMIENPLILSKLLSDASQFLSLNSSELIGAIAHPRTVSRTECDPLLPATIFRKKCFGFGITIHDCLRFVQF